MSQKLVEQLNKEVYTATENADSWVQLSYTTNGDVERVVLDEIVLCCTATDSKPFVCKGRQRREHVIESLELVRQELDAVLTHLKKRRNTETRLDI